LARTTVIIGGGAMGSAIACFLSDRMGRGDTIVVIERDPSYARASSALSCSSIRQQFSTPLNIQLSQFGWSHMQECTGSDVAGAAVGLQQRGYLFLGRAGQEAALRHRSALARSLGVPVREFTNPELSLSFPWMQTEGISYATQAAAGEGWFDGYMLLQWYRSRAREAGVRYLKGEVAGFAMRESTVTAVHLDSGLVMAGDAFVNAAGPWSAEVARQVGVDIPVRPRRRTPFLVSCPTPLPDFPILVDASGVYIRPEGSRFVAIISPRADADPDEPPLDPDFTLFEDVIWPTLAERVPAFEALRVERPGRADRPGQLLRRHRLQRPRPDAQRRHRARHGRTAERGRLPQHRPLGAVARAAEDGSARGRRCHLLNAGQHPMTSIDWPQQIFDELMALNVRQVAYVPDAGHSQLITLCHAEASMRAVSLTTEEEGVAMLAGAWLGGERGVLLLQSSGVGNCINMLSLQAETRMPLCMIVTMRGEWGEFNPWQVAMGQSTQPVLEASGVHVYRADTAAEVAPHVAAGARFAYQTGRSVAVLIGQRVIGSKNFRK
jgi:sulfopyruvate decarboxylase alpha subunit